MMAATGRSKSTPAPIHYLRALALAALIAAFAYVLQDAYARRIAPVFSYLGLTYRAPSALGLALSVVCVITIGFTLPRRVKSLPDFVLWTLFLIAVAPSVLITQYADVVSRDDAGASAIVMTAVFLLLVAAARGIRNGPSLRLRIPPQFLHLSALAFTLLLTGYLVSSGTATLDLVGLTEVQDVRSSYKSLVASTPMLGYAIQFQTAVLNPIFMTIGVARRQLMALVAGVGGQVVIYSVTGFKLTVLSPIFVIGLAMALKRRTSISGATLTSSLTVAMALAGILDTLTNTHLFVTVFVNRLIATPGVLTSAYYRVFQGQPKYYWSQSFMSPLLDSPYDMSPGYLVGRLYQHADTQANASFLADGYANGGWTGVLVEAVFVLVVLALVHAAGRDLPLMLTAPSSLVAALGLANNSPFSSVLTGGFGGLIVVFAIWPRTEGLDPAPSQPGTPRSSTQDLDVRPRAGARSGHV